MRSGEGFAMKNFIVRTVHLFRVVKSRRLKWEGHLSEIGGKGAFKILAGKPIVKNTSRVA